MLNRIRRAASLTRARYFPRGRHRRSLTPSRPPTVPACRVGADGAPAVLAQASVSGTHRHSLPGEDIALVRPYVLAWDKRVRPRSVVVAPHLPAEAWSTLAGAR
ncbi:hypothetical protein ACF068_15275 [Streptomyces sp. NPDC016309]|uniref:hypothetical protein n=1 Tax=Streptomyces sp. NPDC016309 TaxID=3364965 RepID=UPI00370111C2